MEQRLQYISHYLPLHLDKSLDSKVVGFKTVFDIYEVLMIQVQGQRMETDLTVLHELLI